MIFVKQQLLDKAKQTIKEIDQERAEGWASLYQSYVNWVEKKNKGFFRRVFLGPIIIVEFPQFKRNPYKYYSSPFVNTWYYPDSDYSNQRARQESFIDLMEIEHSGELITVSLDEYRKFGF